MGIRGLQRLAVGTLLATVSLVGLEAQGAQLRLSWVDNSGGQAYVSVERKAVDGAYEGVATLAAGLTTYTDAAVVSGAVYCYRVQAYDEAAASGYSNEACGAVAQGLDVAVAVAGSGMVTSSPAGITCGTDCTESFASGAVVMLAATPMAGALFTGWSGGECSGTGLCTLSGNVPVSLTATFGSASPTVTLVVSGDPATGPYTVEATSSSSGDIRVEFWVDGALRQTENSGPYFLFGDTSGVPAKSTLGAGAHTVLGKVYAQTGSTVLAEAAITVTEGAPAPTTYAVTVAVSGSGMVTSAPAGITCGTDCAESYASGMVVTLTAAPKKGWKFVGWTGACGGTGTCSVTLGADSMVEAAFFKGRAAKN